MNLWRSSRIYEVRDPCPEKPKRHYCWIKTARQLTSISGRRNAKRSSRIFSTPWDGLRLPGVCKALKHSMRKNSRRTSVATFATSLARTISSLSIYLSISYQIERPTLATHQIKPCKDEIAVLDGDPNFAYGHKLTALGFCSFNPASLAPGDRANSPPRSCASHFGGEYSFTTNCTNFHELLHRFRVCTPFSCNSWQIFSAFWIVCPNSKYTPRSFTS